MLSKCRYIDAATILTLDFSPRDFSWYVKWITVSKSAMFGAVCFMVRQWMARLIFWVIVGHFSKLWIVFGCLQFRQHKLNRNKIAIYCSLGSGDLRNWCISPKKSQSRTSQLTYSSQQIRHQQLTDCCLHIEIVYTVFLIIQLKVKP